MTYASGRSPPLERGCEELDIVLRSEVGVAFGKIADVVGLCSMESIASEVVRMESSDIGWLLGCCQHPSKDAAGSSMVMKVTYLIDTDKVASKPWYDNPSRKGEKVNIQRTNDSDDGVHDDS
jgi:hypothetical protein